MEIQELKNGQIQVKHENLTLIQTNEKGFKVNDCEIDMGDYFLIVKNSDERFKPLFVALHNHKNNN